MIFKLSIGRYFSAQTFLVKEKTGIHYGYWRDEPDGECLIARNDSTKNCEFTFVADNIFGAIL